LFLLFSTTGRKSVRDFPEMLQINIFFCEKTFQKAAPKMGEPPCVFDLHGPSQKPFMFPALIHCNEIPSIFALSFAWISSERGHLTAPFRAIFTKLPASMRLQTGPMTNWSIFKNFFNFVLLRF